MHATEFLKAPREPLSAPIVALYGSERFLKRSALETLVARVFGEGAADAPVTHIAGKDAEYAEVMDTLLTVSMWAPRQLVVVDDADDFVSAHRAQLEKYLDRPARKAVLVLDVKSWPATTRLAKKTAEVGLPLECAPLKPAELTAWLVEAARLRHGCKLDRAAAQLLVELAGTELGLLDQELAKLAAYAGAQKTIDPEAVQTLVGGWKAETTWKMLDAVRDGHLGTALQLLEKLLTSGEHPLKLLGGVNYSYRPIAQTTELTRQGIPLNTALQQAGVKPFQAQAVTTYLKRIGRPRAEQISQWLLDADLDVKGRSSLPERVVLERLLAQLAGASP